MTVFSLLCFNINQLKSVKQSVSDFPDFTASAVLNSKKFSNGISEINVDGATVTSPGKLFSGVKVNDEDLIYRSRKEKINNSDTKVKIFLFDEGVAELKDFVQLCKKNMITKSSKRLDLVKGDQSSRN